MGSKFDVAFALYVKREIGRYFGAGNVHGLTFSIQLAHFITTDVQKTTK